VSEILIYEDIGWGGMTPKRFADAMPKDGAISVRINSAGGDVFDGITIATRLWGRESTAYIDGIAASAASVIAAGARRVVAAVGSMLMIHDPWTMLAGDAEEMREQAEVMDKVGDQIAAIYARKAGGTVEEWRARMVEETWLTAEEAKALGLVDEIAEGLKIAACTNLHKYAYANKERAMDLFNKERVAALETEIQAKAGELLSIRAELDKTTAELGEAIARADAAEAAAKEAEAKLAAELAEAGDRIEAAKREAIKAALSVTAPPVVDGSDPETVSHSEQYDRLWAAQKFAEARAYMATHRAAILRGE
jgi:ATP-dependent protease ClpP protease subunit